MRWAPGVTPASRQISEKLLVALDCDRRRMMWGFPTKVPRPCILVRYPSEQRSSMARRTVMRLTPYSSLSSASEGIFSSTL